MSLQRPNIIVMTCHDLGAHLPCYGVSTVRAPRLDELAGQSVVFENAFCTAPQCSPSRASLFTGQYPHRTGVIGLAHDPFSWEMHRPQAHLANRLGNAGYATAGVGVIHEARDIHRLGFDRILDAPHFLSNEMADVGGAFIAESARGDKPFYLQVGFVEPHRPFDFGGAPPDRELGVTVPPYLVDDESAREEFAGFQGAIRQVDRAVGTVLDAIKKSGQADNTIVIFTTDHGIPFPRAKCSVYDPGLRTALMIRWPSAGIAPGRRAQMISNIDILPSLLEWCQLPPAEPVDGRSLAAIFAGKSDAGRDRIFGQMTYHDYFDPRRCIRTHRHKLIANFTAAPFFMNPSQDWRPKTITVDPPNPPYAYHVPIELYDLEADPLETRNLADKPEHAALTRSLANELHEWMTTTADPLLAGVPISPMHQRAVDFLAARTNQ